MRQFLYTGTYHDQYGQTRTFHRTSPHWYTHALIAYVTHDPRTGARLAKPYYTSPRLVWWTPEEARIRHRHLRRGQQAVRLHVTCESVTA